MDSCYELQALKLKEKDFLQLLTRIHISAPPHYYFFGAFCAHKKKLLLFSLRGLVAVRKVFCSKRNTCRDGSNTEWVG